MIELEQQADALVRRTSELPLKAARAWQIAKHYRWSQIARRGLNVAKAKLFGNRPLAVPPGPDSIQLRQLAHVRQLAQIIVANQAVAGEATHAELLEGKLTRLNHQIDVGWPIDWNAANRQAHLWRFQLHYHEFLLPLAAAGSTNPADDNATAPAILNVIQSWLDHHSPEKIARVHDSWHPYCISRRLPVWIWLLALNRFAEESLPALAQSLFQQASFLHDHLETDLGGNHLLENLTALAISAAVIEHGQSEQWLATVGKCLDRELSLQVLEYGEHYELSPMYHCQILSNLLRIAWSCQQVAPKLSQQCRQTAALMLEFLHNTLHPDQAIALLGDSGFGESPSVPEINQLAELNALPAAARPSVFQTLGPYWLYRSQTGEDFLIFDRGPTAADELPAHGHCDLLGFEASIGGQRWFVDSGNFNYESDSMRNYCRSSLAHNVVTIAGENQSEIWSKFRMGKRASVLSTAAGQQSGFHWGLGRCNAYRDKGVLHVDRLLAISPEQQIWICAEMVFHNAVLAGPPIAYLHLAPKIQILEAAAAGRWQLSDGDNTRWLVFFNVASLKRKPGWYCPEFGRRFENTVIQYGCQDTRQPFGWCLVANRDSEITTDTSERKLTCSDQNSTLFDWTF